MRSFSSGAAAFAAVLNMCFAYPAQAAVPAYFVAARIPGADGSWDFANIDPAHGALYVARGDAIMKVDLATQAVVNRLASAKGAHQVLVLDGGATLFETDGATDLARFVKADDGTVLAELHSGAKPDAAFLDPKTGLIAVMNADDGKVTLIDSRTRSLAGSIDVGGGLEFGVADGRGGAFINIEDKNEIARVDLVTKRRTGTIALPGCEGPTGLALVNRKRLIAACANERALVVDIATGKVLTTLPIGRDPDAVLVDEMRGLAFIPCGGSGTLVALSIAGDAPVRIVQRIKTQIGAKTGAIDPRDGRIYLPTATLAAPLPGAKRGVPQPGTFAVLVVAPKS
jgi:DNA-binding beta-propeller fold protein YncE